MPAKPNYTAKQNEIAEWIVIGHDADIIRADTQTRCYITTAYGSNWYNFLKTGAASGGIGEEMGSGSFRLAGKCPGGPTTVNHSSFCGTVIYNYDRCTRKRKFFFS